MTKINLNDKITIRTSQVVATVVGYATHTKALDLYQVEYVDGIGNVQSPWLYEKDIDLLTE